MREIAVLLPTEVVLGYAAGASVSLTFGTWNRRQRVTHEQERISVSSMVAPLLQCAKKNSVLLSDFCGQKE